MAQPSTRQELIDYCLRQLGAPVLEINVADEQIEDLVDDAIQYFQERHFDGVTQVYLKYQVTQDDINRGRARPPGAPQNQSGTTGIASTSATTNKDQGRGLIFADVIRPSQSSNRYYYNILLMLYFINILVLLP